MRIALTGAHGVGKTTLGLALCNALGDKQAVEFNNNIARKLISEGYPLNMEATADSYIHYIIEQLSAEQLCPSCSVFISDRTLLDPLAYALTNQFFSSTTVPGAIIELLQRVWLLEKEQYDFYVMVPIEFPMAPDGIRPCNEPYRQAIEDQIIALLNRYKVNYVRVSGSVFDRCDQVLDRIKLLRAL